MKYFEAAGLISGGRGKRFFCLPPLPVKEDEEPSGSLKFWEFLV
jgi:hypothetical protein